MCCPRCETGTLHTSIPAIGDQEPVMSCRLCGVHLTSDVLDLYVDRKPEVVDPQEELKAA